MSVISLLAFFLSVFSSTSNLQVLDVTSNEPWGPHGSIMADIAQATRN